MRPQSYGDFLVARRERLRHSSSSGGEISAGLSRLGDARQGIRHRFSVNQQDALVAFDDFRNIALRHDGACSMLRQRFDGGVEIHILFAYAEHRAPRHSVERFENHVMMLRQEFQNQFGPARYQAWHGKFIEFGDGELFVEITQRLWLVENSCSLCFGEFQQISAVDVLHIVRRVLAHQHHIEALKRHYFNLAGPIPVVLIPGQREFSGMSQHPAELQYHILLLHDVERMAAGCRLNHHGEAGVLVNLEGVKRIENESEVHG